MAWRINMRARMNIHVQCRGPCVMLFPFAKLFKLHRILWYKFILLNVPGPSKSLPAPLVSMKYQFRLARKCAAFFCDKASTMRAIFFTTMIDHQCACGICFEWMVIVLVVLVLVVVAVQKRKVVMIQIVAAQKACSSCQGNWLH